MSDIENSAGEVKASESDAIQACKATESYVIIETGGHQYKVSEGEKILVNRLELEKGEEFKIDKVLLMRSCADNEDSLTNGLVVGKPYIEGATVLAQVIGHTRGKKIRVFKKRRRQGYKKTIGHRQDLTEVRIGKLEYAG
jgi:large subunit ribosomal protein L21